MQFICKVLSFLIMHCLLQHVDILNKHFSFFYNKSVVTAVKWFIYFIATGCMFTHVYVLAN